MRFHALIAAMAASSSSRAARLMLSLGSKVIAVSDSTGGIRNATGLDIDKVIAWKQEHGTVQGFPGSTDITNAEVLETECDVLIPAALENQITGDNAERIKAKIEKAGVLVLADAWLAGAVARKVVPGLSVRGALVAALLIGLADVFGQVVFPQIAGMTVYLVMAAVLLWRPRGLFGSA